MQLHVPPSQPALPIGPLGHRVERHHLGARLDLWGQRGERSAGGDKGSPGVVYVLLIDFIGEQQQVVAMAEQQHISKVVFSQTSSSGVSLQR